LNQLNKKTVLQAHNITKQGWTRSHCYYTLCKLSLHV